MKRIKEKIKSFLLVLLILFSQGWTAVSSVGSDVTASTCDADIKSLKIDISDYEEYDYSLILFAEVNDKELMVYFYEPSGNNCKEIDIDYVSSDNYDGLDTAKSTHYVKKLKLLSTSSDGKVKKLLVEDLEVDKTNSFRKYSINQIIGDLSIDGIHYNSYTIGSYYIYHDVSDEKVEYVSNEFNYMTIKDAIVYDANIMHDKTKDTWSWTDTITGKNYSFIGFSTYIDLLIKNLLEVEVYYKLSDYSCYIPTFTTDLRYRYNYENYEKAINNEGVFVATGFDRPYAEMYSESYSVNYEEYDVTITPEEVEETRYNKSWWGRNDKKITWNTIMRKTDIDTYFSGKSNETLREDFKDKLGDRNWIINFYQSEEDFTATQIYGTWLGYTGAYYNDDKGPELSSNLNGYMMACKGFSIYDVDKFEQNGFYKYESKRPREVMVTRLKFMDFFENIYDVKVIQAPIDSSGFIKTEADNPTWWEEFLEMIKMILIILIIIMFIPALVPIVGQIGGVIARGVVKLFELIKVGLVSLWEKIKIGAVKVIEFIRGIFKR